MPIRTVAEASSAELKGSEGGIKCLAEGTYLVALEKVEVKESHDALTFVIVGGPQSGKKIFDNFYYTSNDGDPKACHRRFQIAAKAFGEVFEKDEEIDIDLADHLNRCCVVNYRCTGTYKDNKGREQDRWGFNYGIHPISRESIDQLIKVEWDEESIEALRVSAINEPELGPITINEIIEHRDQGQSQKAKQPPQKSPSQPASKPVKKQAARPAASTVTGDDM